MKFYHVPFQRKEYVRYAKVFPLTNTFDYKLPSKWYRRAVGGLEILFGLILALVPSRKWSYLIPETRVHLTGTLSLPNTHLFIKSTESKPVSFSSEL